LGDPLSLTVNFAGPVAYGGFDIAVRPVRTNRSSQHWSLEMTQDDQVVTTATVVTGKRRETWSDTEAHLPDVPAPEDLETSEDFRGVKWVENYDIRFVEGPCRTRAARRARRSRRRRCGSATCLTGRWTTSPSPPSA